MMRQFNSEPKLLIINGSLGGANGNTAVGLNHFIQIFTAKNVQCEIIHLNDLFQQKLSNEEFLSFLEQQISEAQGFVFATGTYWDSWGSPLQKFLELITPLENQKLLLGKPIVTFVTMHSVGGKSVLSRLQGVLNSFGFYQPPLCGIVYSMVNELITQAKIESTFKDDLWSTDDFKVICENLIIAMQKPIHFHPWPVDRDDPHRIWWK